ncbi:MAG: ATP-dependent Clp protease adaptor ClpS [Planctomycetota bacterium]
MTQAMAVPVADGLTDVAESAARPRRQPPYAVVLHNDESVDINFALDTLRVVFGFGADRAAELVTRVHETGRAVVWSGMREHAELKAEQISSRTGDPGIHAGRRPRLTVSVEAMPG